MATNKATSTPGTGLAKWQEKLGLAAVEAVASTGKDTANVISIKGGVMKYHDVRVPKGELDVIIVGHVLVNKWYSVKFEPDSKETPDCFAIGRLESEMAPHPNSPKPQSDRCEDCPKNQYESADTGRGKACSNTRKLGVIAEDTAGEILKAAIATLSVPPTSIKAYDKYVKDTASILKRAPMGVITKIKVEPDEVKQVVVSFDNLGLAEESMHFPKDINQGFEDLFEKQIEVFKTLETPYDKKVEGAKKTPAKAAGGAARKFTKPAPTKMTRR
jgi:hypothetical protein